MAPYRKGLQELGSGCYAWMQPDGGWGLSNSGLITGNGVSLMVDTLFDLRLTQAMLDGVAPVLETHPVRTVVNTHSDGDHIFGNELLAARGAEIVASAAAAELMTQGAIDHVVDLLGVPGAQGAFIRHAFGAFRFDEVTVTPPHRTFEGALTVDVGGRDVQLIQVGPAHTAGDTLVYVPDAKLLYSGDILFSGGTPVVWAGPIERWVAALDLILSMEIEQIVPGHGPVSGKSEVQAARDYLTFVAEETHVRFERGLTADEAIADIDLGRWARLPERGRLAQNVINEYRQLDPESAQFDRLWIFNRMAALEGFAAAEEIH